MGRKHRKSGIKSIAMGCLLIVVGFMAAGYAILSQKLFVNSEVNILTAEKYLWYNIINNYPGTSTEGFVTNEYENGKYSYVGNGDNNYITLNDELWKIVSIESDHTIKVVRWDSTINKEFDTANNRTNSSTYCKSLEYGCNSWNSKSVFENGTINGNVENDSTLLTYLNTTYYNGLSDTFKNQITEHAFNIGAVEQGVSIQQALSQESEYTWYGHVGLLSLSDIIYPGSSSTTTTNTTLTNSNYLLNYSSDKFMWTINPVRGNSNEVWVISYDKKSIGKNANSQSEDISNTNYKYVALPTIYLKNTVQYNSGNGTINQPFTIK